jgi:hypothetical protein
MCKNKIKKTVPTWLKGAILGCALAAPIQSQAIELENPSMCSSGITNMMSDMGLMAYKMADFMNGFCKSIPFFGMFCPDLDKMAGAFFSEVMENPDLTLDMLACADANPSMLDFMLHVIDENPSLLTQMGTYMGQTGDGSSKGCALGELFTDMATRHDNLKNFFFAKINEDLYRNYSDNVFYCKTDTAVSLSELIKYNAKQAMAEDTPFGGVLRAIHPEGTTHDDAGGHDHSNHVANERMFYSLFSNVEAGLNFMNGLSQIEQTDQKSMMDFLFLGRVVIPARTCSYWDWRCTPTEEVINDHPFESSMYMYSMIQAMADGVLPAYQLDAEHPPVADINVPANALFGQFFPLMLTEDYQINEYGMSFFKSLISGWLTHGWKPSEDVSMHMMGLVNLQQVPFTMEDLGNLMSVLNDPCSADPAIVFEDKDDDHHGDCGSDGGDTGGDGTSTDPDPEPTPEPEPVYIPTSEQFNGMLNWYEDKTFGPFTSGPDGISVSVTGDGDVNLYVYKDTTSRYRYDCISDTYRTSNESCTLSDQATYYILVDGYGYANRSNYSMTVNY